jgi:hypothetical protein
MYSPKQPPHTHLVHQRANYLSPSIVSLIWLSTLIFIADSAFMALGFHLCNAIRIEGIANL